MNARENQLVIFDPEAKGITLDAAKKELGTTTLEGFYVILAAETCPPEYESAVAQVEQALAQGGVPPGSIEWCICQALEAEDDAPCILADMDRIVAITNQAEA